MDDGREREPSLPVEPSWATRSTRKLRSTAITLAEAATREGAPAVPEALGGYLVLRKLGSGGQGWVYEAFDPERKRRVAVKFLRRARGVEGSAAEQRLKREFRAAADLNHRNVAKLYELAHDAGLSYCVMELIEGSNLAAYLQQALRELDAQEKVTRAARELSLGVSALHATGILHRDIKTANVMVEHATNRVVLLDFGLALSHCEPIGGEIAGTIGYLAPEVVAGQGPSFASDWYGAGAVLYEGLSGTRAFDRSPGEDGGSTLRWPADVALRFPSLCRLVERMLALDPQERATRAEIAHELSLSEHALAKAGLQPIGPPAGIDLIGREEQLARLDHAYDVARAGKPALVLVRGESGIGKSALAQAFLARIARQGATILRGLCHERERIPYRAIDDVVCRLAERLDTGPGAPAVAPSLGQAFPVFRRRVAHAEAAVAEDPAERLKSLVEGLTVLLRSIAGAGPVVLAIEDLQWGDRDSAHVLAAILSDPTLPILMIGTWRDGDTAAGFVEAFDHALSSQQALARFELSLGPLAPEHTLQLLKRLSPLAADVGPLVRASGGVPFVVEELARACEEGRLNEFEDQPVERLLAQRLADDCPPYARHFMQLLAVAGRPMEQAVLLEFAGVDAEAHAMLSRLRNQRLVRTDGPRANDLVDVYHHRIRAAVLATMHTDEQAAHHLRFARGLARDAHSDPAQVAHHYFRSPCTEEGVPYAQRAALLAEQAFAFEQSADLYRQALRFGSASAVDRLELQRRLARVLELRGHTADAALEYLGCAELASGVEADRARCAAAENFLASGHIAPGSQALEPLFSERKLPFPRTPVRAMLRLLPLAARLWLRREQTFPSGAPPAGPASALASASDPRGRRSDLHLEEETSFRLDLYWAAAKGLAAVDPVRAGYFLCAGLAAAQRARSPFAIARFGALFSAAVLSPAGGALAEWGRDLLVGAQRVADATGDVYLAGLVSVSLGQWHLQRGDWQACCERTARGHALFEQHCVGVEWESNIAYMGRWRALEELGEFVVAEQDVQRALSQAGRRGDRYGEVTALLYRGVLRIVRGDLPGAEEDARVVLETWTHHPQLHVQHAYACRIRVMCALARGDAASAWRELDAIWPRLVRSGMLRSSLMHIDFCGLRARCALAWGALDEAPAKVRRIRDRLVERLLRHPRVDARAVGLLVQAGSAHQRGRAQDCIQLLELACGAFVSAHQPVHADVCRLLHSELRGDETELARHTASLRTRGVADPRRWTRVVAPAF